MGAMLTEAAGEAGRFAKGLREVLGTKLVVVTTFRHCRIWVCVCASHGG